MAISFLLPLQAWVDWHLLDTAQVLLVPYLGPGIWFAPTLLINVSSHSLETQSSEKAADSELGVGFPGKGRAGTQGISDVLKKGLGALTFPSTVRAQS